VDPSFAEVFHPPGLRCGAHNYRRTLRPFAAHFRASCSCPRRWGRPPRFGSSRRRLAASYSCKANERSEVSVSLPVGRHAARHVRAYSVVRGHRRASHSGVSSSSLTNPGRCAAALGCDASSSASIPRARQVLRHCSEQLAGAHPVRLPVLRPMYVHRTAACKGRWGFSLDGQQAPFVRSVHHGSRIRGLRPVRHSCARAVGATAAAPLPPRLYSIEAWYTGTAASSLSPSPPSTATKPHPFRGLLALTEQLKVAARI